MPADNPLPDFKEIDRLINFHMKIKDNINVFSTNLQPIKNSNYIANELEDHDSGTSIKIKLGGNPSESPRDLSWLNVTEPEIWHKLLRAKTPLGNLDPINKKTKVSVSVQVTDKNGNSDGKTFSNKENSFYYPHFYFNNIQYIKDILDEREKQSPWSIDNTKHSFKNLDAVMQSWTHNEILDSGDFSSISKDEEKRKLIEKYQVSVDVTVLQSATAR